MNIQLHIERLVLDRLPVAAGQGPLVQAAVEKELTHLLATGQRSSPLFAERAVSSLQAGTIQLPSESSAANLGMQIGQAVYRGFGR